MSQPSQQLESLVSRLESAISRLEKINLGGSSSGSSSSSGEAPSVSAFKEYISTHVQPLIDICNQIGGECVNGVSIEICYCSFYIRNYHDPSLWWSDPIHHHHEYHHHQTLSPLESTLNHHHYYHLNHHHHYQHTGQIHC